MHLSNLINSLPPYHFADAKKKIADRKAAGVDVINLSMGDPDLPAALRSAIFFFASAKW